MGELAQNVGVFWKMVVASNFDFSSPGVLDAALTLDPDDGVIVVAIAVVAAARFVFLSG